MRTAAKYRNAVATHRCSASFGLTHRASTRLNAAHAVILQARGEGFESPWLHVFSLVRRHFLADWRWQDLQVQQQIQPRGDRSRCFHRQPDPRRPNGVRRFSERPGVVVVGNEGVAEGLQAGQGLRLPGLGCEPFLRRLVEPLHLPAGSGMVQPGMLLCHDQAAQFGGEAVDGVVASGATGYAFDNLSSSASLQRCSAGSLGPPQPERHEPTRTNGGNAMSIKITVEGHLTKAPELRKTTLGKSVTRFDLHNFRERLGKDFKDVATIFFSASVWEEDGAPEVAELGLTKGSRVSVDGLWSKRTWTTKEGERRVTDVLTVSKVRLFTETEVARPEAVGDDAEPTPDEAIGQPAA